MRTFQDLDFEVRLQVELWRKEGLTPKQCLNILSNDLPEGSIGWDDVFGALERLARRAMSIGGDKDVYTREIVDH